MPPSYIYSVAETMMKKIRLLKIEHWANIPLTLMATSRFFILILAYISIATFCHVTFLSDVEKNPTNCLGCVE